jgi:hypothetical protein
MNDIARIAMTPQEHGFGRSGVHKPPEYGDELIDRKPHLF